MAVPSHELIPAAAPSESSTQRPSLEPGEQEREPSPAAPEARGRVSALEKRIQELERSGSDARSWLDERAPRATGVKVKANLPFPTWNETSDGAHPDRWVQRFKRFLRLSEGGYPPSPSAETTLLVHAVPPDTLLGRRLAAKLRSPEYARLEQAQDDEACLNLLYEVLGQEQDDPLIRRSRIRNRWISIAKRDVEGWSSFANRWTELLLDMEEEKMSPAEDELYYRLIDAVAKDGGGSTGGGCARGRTAVRELLQDFLGL